MGDTDESELSLFAEQGELFEDDKSKLSPEFTFDEMNIVEMPIALLTRDTSGIYEIPLSDDGQSRLVCSNSSKYGLPNSLAPRVVLGLMWLWAKEYSQDEQTFTFKLRDLVKNYMWPERFRKYPPNGELQRSVERQIHCLAGSQIHTDRWWDSRRRAHKEVDISIIDGVVTVDGGGHNRPRVLEVTWGRYFWQSLRDRYTKPIDARIVQKLDRPLDLALYRLLDRQLRMKPRQRYNNIIHLARFKLGMQGQKISAGGRTASSYIAKCLREALSRLSREEFSVRMIIDRSTDIFAITFERIEHRVPEQPHEVCEQDQAAELIREFAHLAHGVPKDKRRTRIAQADRKLAQAWIGSYGVDQARAMVGHCLALQKQRGAEDVLTFRGLSLYEDAAAGAYARSKPTSKRKGSKLTVATLDSLWECYQDALVQAFDREEADNAPLREQLQTLALSQAQQQLARLPNVPDALVRDTAAGLLRGLKREHMGGFSHAQFLKFRAAPEMRAALQERHGFDPLGDDGQTKASLLPLSES